jgi:hypothetical protein
MVVKLKNTTWPPPPQFSLHNRRAALSSYSNGTYIAEITQNAVYIVRCLWVKSPTSGAGITISFQKGANICF